KAKVMIRVIRGMLADLRLKAAVPRRDAPSLLGEDVTLRPFLI
ncbi:MAG: hypothetical protein PWP65_1168, partial [Clostridia bacterium]|nr:hypothetical protein [Clostridia bacterium]